MRALAAACALVALAAALHGAAAYDNGLGRTPPLGWNTWMTCGDSTCGHDVCSEAEVKSIATAMQANGMQAMGYEYINLDDCWGGQRSSTGEYTWDANRFPSGIPALTAWLHQRGFKFGLYTSAGNTTCSSGGRPFPVPGSRGHYAEDAKTFASWGVDYVKFDWCGDIKKEWSEGANAHREWAAAVNASGRAMFMEVVAGYFFLWGEVADNANSWRFCEDHHDAWSSTSEQILCRLDQSNVTGAPGGWPYMDFLHTGGMGCTPFSKGPHCPGQSDDAYATTFTLWSLTQSPLIVDTDVRNMTDIMKAALLNKELIDIHQSTDTPPGKQIGTWPCSELFACTIWGRPLTTDGSSWAVALVNGGSKAHSLTLNWSDLGWASTATATVRDLWSHTDLSSATGSFVASSVPSHGSRVIKLTKSS